MSCSGFARFGYRSMTFIKGKKMKQSLLVAALIALAVSACGKKEAPAAPAAPAAAPAAEAQAAPAAGTRRRRTPTAAA